MENIIKLGAAAKTMKGKLQNCSEELVIEGVSTDSRKIEKNNLFIALAGDNFDGHKFVGKAIENGAVCAVVNKDADDFSGMPVILVEDTHMALKDLAEYYRTLFNIPVIGITGSVGKTSTKEMIASVLKEQYETHMTMGNFNNEIGLPLTVFGLENSADIMVLEMGMSAFGEISNLTKIAKPSTAVITNIGVSHIENLGSREGIRKAKFEIFESMNQDGSAFLNGDDDLLWDARGSMDIETMYYGIENKNADLVAYNIKTYSEGSEFSCKIYGEENHFSINVPGMHHIYNALAAILVGIKYNIDIDLIKDGIKKFVPNGLRQTLLEIGRYRVIQDCYNASPASMRSGLDVLALTETTGRRVACLADMLELGVISDYEHRNVGKNVFEKGVDCLITVGKHARLIAKGAKECGMDENNIFVFENNQDLKDKLTTILKDDDLVLVKGSRGMKLEEIVEAIKELA